MIRILNVEPLAYSETAREILRQVGQVNDAPLSRQELVAQLGDYDVLIVRLGHQIDREVIDAGTRLKAIVSATTGLDHIDVEYARARGIMILSLQGETEFLRTISATAEHTWALLLSLLRHIPSAFASVCNGEWDRDRFRGHELNGKRLGIVGLGRIGQKVARYGFAFGMSVAAFDPLADEWLSEVARVESLDELLAVSDVLTLHIPLRKETHGLIDARALSLLPVGAILVNTSRGEIVDETALMQALTNGHLAGAALDVIHHERDSQLRRASPLFEYARAHNHLLITPHIGGATFESMARTEIFMAEKLTGLIKTMRQA
ncbi:hydroxyacid dehydrogenase [Anaerolineae bacterium CFX7]|nr:hydroxyacid dehydrogenase [Anaerolineae bacterium CFX7]